jgi:hypothetical protein
VDEVGGLRGTSVELNKTKESYIQRTDENIFGNHVPIIVGMEQLMDGRDEALLVGVTETSMVATGKDTGIDSLCVLDAKNLNKIVQRITLPRNERVSCISVGRIATETSHDYGDEVVVVGTATEVVGQEPVEGKLYMIEKESLVRLGNEGLTDASTTLVFSEDGSGPAGPVTCTLIVGGFLIATAGRTLAIYKRGSASLVHCASVDVDYYITSVDAKASSPSQMRIISGDMSRSVTLVEYADNTLTVVGKDWTPASVTAVSFIDYERFVFSDNVGNLYVAALLDRPSKRIERVEGICLGSVVSAMKRSNDGVVQIGLKDGSVYELVSQTRTEEYEPIENSFLGPVYDPHRDQSHIPTLRYEA